MKLIQRLWQETDGAILSAEVMLVATMLVLGVIVGLKSVRDSVVSELADVAQAVDSASQSHWFAGKKDKWDRNDDGWSGSKGNPSCVNVCAKAWGES